mmetsp:Transcript_1649/g.5257  ORF Transcript_1649/g.5257 Transcript_1649/m.5257 type:complete len:289 (+) Transcript_1649:326-1192(+)
MASKDAATAAAAFRSFSMRIRSSSRRAASRRATSAATAASARRRSAAASARSISSWCRWALASTICFRLAAVCPIVASERRRAYSVARRSHSSCSATERASFPRSLWTCALASLRAWPVFRSASRTAAHTSRDAATGVPTLRLTGMAHCPALSRRSIVRSTSVPCSCCSKRGSGRQRSGLASSSESPCGAGSNDVPCAGGMDRRVGTAKHFRRPSTTASATAVPSTLTHARRSSVAGTGTARARIETFDCHPSGGRDDAANPCPPAVDRNRGRRWKPMPALASGAPPL